MRLRPVSFAAVPLVLTIAAAAVSRFAWLDLMEFKGDEANACRLALHVLGYREPGVRSFFPTEGLVSSVGVPNPPLFIYLIALPLAVVRSPIAAAACVAALNVLAVWLSYWAGQRLFSRFVGVAAAALLALSPWGIIFSRKIWAQDLLPLCGVLFLLQLHWFVVEGRQRALFWLVVIAAVATQLHFSAWILVLVLLAAIIARRRSVSWLWGAAGVAVAAGLYAPFLIIHGAQVLHAIGHRSHQFTPDAIGRFETAGRLMLAIVAGGQMSFLIGSGSRLATVLSALLGITAIAGLVAMRRATDRTMQGLLFLWYLLPLVVLTVVRVQSYIHYFIILMPLPYLGIARAFELLTARKHLRMLLVGVCLCCFAALDARVFHTVIKDGGAPGQYGIGYRYKHAAAVLLLQESETQPFKLGISPDFNASPVLRPYQFLIWNAEPDRGPPTSPATIGYVLVNRLEPIASRPRLPSQLRQFRLGPLTLVAIPLRPSHGARRLTIR